MAVEYGNVNFNVQVLIGAILTIIIITTVLGNALVLLAIFTQRSLQVVSNFFLVSLAMADILVGVFVMPLAMLDKMFGYWIFGSEICALWTSLNVMLTSASILSLCIISVDRYLIITAPLKYKHRMSPQRALFLIFCAWSLSTLATILPIHFHWHGPTVDSVVELHNVTAILPQCMFVVTKTYALCTSILFFFVPLMLIMYTYTQIFRAAREQANRIGPLPSVDDDSVVHVKDTWYSRLKQRHQNLKGKKAMKTLGIIVGTFWITWLPFYILIIIEAFCACMHPNLHSLLTWLGYCNSTVNPIIYPMLMRDFRKVLLTFCRRKCRFGPGVTRMALSSTMRATVSVVCDGAIDLPNDGEQDSTSFYSKDNMIVLD
ncbi:5-hydroxytryptamine receptor 6-like [Glandiceps talaboti]